MKRLFCVLICLLMLAACLYGCQKEETIPTTETTEPTTEATEPPPVEEVTMVVTEDTIRELEEYPELKKADLRGSTCYAAIEDYIAKHPNVKVQYTVAVGELAVPPDVESIALKADVFDYDLLMQNLEFLPALKAISFPEVQLTLEQIEALTAAREGIEVTYTLNAFGKEIASDVETLNLSGIQPEDVEKAVAVLNMLPNVTEVELMSPEGECALSVTDVAALQQAKPDALFQYIFNLFGKQVSTTDERVEYSGVRIGDAGEEELRAALSIMKGCTYMKLESCGFSNDLLAQIREDYRGRTEIVWRVYFGKMGSCTTDRKIIRYVYGLYDDNSAQLKYCEGAEYIDFGHDEFLRDCSFVAGMPNLKAIILSGSSISDLSAFANCPNLEFLEVAYCGYLEDISPLANCPNLKMLNTGFTKVKDFSALDEIGITTLVAPGKVPQEEQERFVSVHPVCRVRFTGSEPYDYPWRYEEDHHTPTEYYQILKDVFQYPHPFETTW